MISRRHFLNRLTIAGATGALGLWPERAATEPPPETTTLRLLHRPTLCDAPEYVAEELLKGEGFRHIQYIKPEPGTLDVTPLLSGNADINMIFVTGAMVPIDAGKPIVLVAGVHVGCVEVFGNDHVHKISDLKGKRVATPALGGQTHLFIAAIAAHVGLSPEKDINWVVHPVAEWQRLLAEGKIDAFLGFPPIAQEARARKIGHVILNTLVDRPWSQYFCCMVAANKEFVRLNPVATKRAVRAILKASNICALEPERVGQFLVDKGYVDRSDYAVQALKEIPYGRWRQYDPADTVRFYALRLHEAGMIKSSPQKIIAQGTDWRFLNELKKELKG